MPRRVAPPDPPLADDTIRLEPITAADADDLDALARDDAVRHYASTPTDPPPGFGETWARVYTDAWRDGGRAGFAIRDARGGPAFLGIAVYVHLDPEAREGEAGYIVAPAARGRGVATRSLRLLTDWGFGELALERIELRIDVTNEVSEAVARRCGYTREGVLRSVHFKEGRRIDFGVWSRLRGEAVPSAGWKKGSR